VVLLAIKGPRESHSCFRVSPALAVLAETPSSSPTLVTGLWKLEVRDCFWDLSAVLEELTPFSMMEPEREWMALTHTHTSPMPREGGRGQETAATWLGCVGYRHCGRILSFPLSLHPSILSSAPASQWVWQMGDISGKLILLCLPLLHGHSGYLHFCTESCRFLRVPSLLQV
jgi:hypothetical protein